VTKAHRVNLLGKEKKKINLPLKLLGINKLQRELRPIDNTVIILNTLLSEYHQANNFFSDFIF
jgi:hypothetical protein